MVDEAHITTIAMHPDYRRRSLGEFLAGEFDRYRLYDRCQVGDTRSSGIQLYGAEFYHKYGFREAGVRRRYYSDNQEDALIMWTDEINSPSYKLKFLELRSALLEKLEIV